MNTSMKQCHSLSTHANVNDNFSFNEQFFTCQLCKQPTEQSIFLSCLHSCCKTCCNQLQSTSALNKMNDKISIGSNNDASITVYKIVECSCCLDRRTFEKYMDSNRLQEEVIWFENSLCELVFLFKQLKNTRELKCHDCVIDNYKAISNSIYTDISRAGAYCFTCRIGMCEVDMNCHAKYTKGHLVFTLEELKDISVNEFLFMIQNRSCPLNNQQELKDKFLFGTNKSFYLPTNSQNLIQVDSFFLEQQIKDWITTRQNDILMLEDRKSKLEQEWGHQNNAVLVFYDELKKALDQRKLVVLEQLSNAYQTLLNPLEDTINSTKQNITYIRYLYELLKFNKGLAIIPNMHDSIQLHLSKLQHNFFVNSPDPYKVALKSNHVSITDCITDNFTVDRAPQTKVDEEYVIKDEEMLFLNNIENNCSSFHYDLSTHESGPLIDICYDNYTDLYIGLYRDWWKSFRVISNCYLVEVLKVKTKYCSITNYSALGVTNSYVTAITSNKQIEVYTKEGVLSHTWTLLYKSPKLLPTLLPESLFLIDRGTDKLFELTLTNKQEPGVNIDLMLPSSSYILDIAVFKEKDQILILARIQNCTKCFVSQAQNFRYASLMMSFELPKTILAQLILPKLTLNNNGYGFYNLNSGDISIINNNGLIVHSFKSEAKFPQLPEYLISETCFRVVSAKKSELVIFCMGTAKFINSW